MDEAIVLQQRDAAAGLDRLRVVKQHIAQTRAALVRERGVPATTEDGRLIVERPSLYTSGLTIVADQEVA